MGQGISDLFFPSNPKLRHRADELGADCKDLERKFEEAKTKFETFEQKLQDSISAFLLANGYSDATSLERKLEEVASSDTMKAWRSLRNSTHVSEKVDQAIWIVVGVAEVAGSTAVPAMVAAGIMSGPAGWAAAGALTAAAVTMALMSIVASAIQGKKQQEKLKDAIVDLFHARQEMKLQVDRLDVLNSFLDHLVVYVAMTGDEKLEQYAPIFKQFESSFNLKWDIGFAVQSLAVLDQARGSWKGADPKPRTVEYAKLVKTQGNKGLWLGKYDKMPLDNGLSRMVAAESARLGVSVAALG
ncbi:hypothetical protein QBC34DRAFT_385536 [Podospora aff. communis PSN243]|uniref:Uncharacterized protein n=1 Tax=Podospora aff. communis PSN243 TaxID=3040156 RepID=A0AAV9GA18_9PEZI|nr:hypothetical protein QBC34DRAFT_385536 [Podospora aff. communis PSN243]